jgi:hypothetical protein
LFHKCRASPKSGVLCRSLCHRSKIPDLGSNSQLRSKINNYIYIRRALSRNWDRRFAINSAHDKRFKQLLLESAISSWISVLIRVSTFACNIEIPELRSAILIYKGTRLHGRNSLAALISNLI